MSGAVLLFAIFGGLLFLNVPIAVSLGVASVVMMILRGAPLSVFPMIFSSAVAKFTLLAVPLFIMTGVIMEKAGISKRLIRLANCLVGHLPGGLAIVGVLTCMFFAAISGSGPATVAALGVVLMPAMIENGYDPGMAAALMATAGGIGVIIPPSIPFVLYGVIAEQSVARLFIAGVVPGIIVGMSLMVASLWVAIRHNYRGVARASLRETWSAFIDAFWGLMAPVIILGGIYGGIFTPTEAAAVAVVWGLMVGIFVYKEITWNTLWETLIDAGSSTAVCMLVAASASAFTWVVTVEGITTRISESLLSFTSSPVVYLLIVNIILLIAGCFIDAISAFYVFTPILLPVALRLGIDPVAFGVIMTVNLAIGLVTPPVGMNLYVACGISKVSLKRISASIVPFLIASLVALVIVTYIPSVSLWLPNAVGVK